MTYSNLLGWSQEKLDRLAMQQGRQSESLVRDAVGRQVGYDEWFIGEVAVEDLEAIADYLFERSPSHAAALVRRLYQALLSGQGARCMRQSSNSANFLRSAFAERRWRRV